MFVLQRRTVLLPLTLILCFCFHGAVVAGAGGTLTITTKPDSSEVFLLTPMGTTPLVDVPMDQGSFTIEVRNRDSRFLPLRIDNKYIDQNNSVTIGDPLPRRHILTPKAWWLIGLGGLSVGSYTWSFVRGLLDVPKANAVPGFVLGTVLLTSMGIVAVF